MRLLVPVLALALTATACGGSSSETPPPLEPDPTSGRYTGPRVSNAPEQAKPEAVTAAPDEDDAPRTPQKPAPGTWGSGKATAPAATPAPAPAPSSEGAGQR
jgi:hypothetical protein